jgi:pimeloyl-ACP methyl ester carboxylesterase
MADDAAGVLDDAGLARVQVVGISMGGMIAQELALRHPDRVGALVLAATYAAPGREIEVTAARGVAVTGVQSPMQMMSSGSFDLSQVDPMQVFKFLTPLVFTPAFLVEKREWLAQFFHRMVGAGFSIAAFLVQVGATQSHDTRARLAALRAPTLVITGDADQLIPARHSDELARLIAGARLEKFPGGSHGFNLEMPDRFNAAVLDFLAAHPLSSG